MTAVPPAPVGFRGAISTADLVESMMGTYGHHVPLDVIARTVHDALHDRAQAGDEAVPPALCRLVDRHVRAAMYTADPGLRPVRSERAEAIARALAGRRG